MKEHGCYLANGEWLKGRDIQNELATWHKIFQRSPSPMLESNQVWMDVIKCCMIIGWTYLALSSFIHFASNLEWLVTKIPKGMFSQLYFYAHFTNVL
jgi:hypothetical protein